MQRLDTRSEIVRLTIVPSEGGYAETEILIDGKTLWEWVGKPDPDSQPGGKYRVTIMPHIEDAKIIARREQVGPKESIWTQYYRCSYCGMIYTTFPTQRADELERMYPARCVSCGAEFMERDG